MTSDNLSVAGIRFRTRADYEAALRDAKKIEEIKSNIDLSDSRQVRELYREMQSGVYRFETSVGNQFDDEIYERMQQIKNSSASNGRKGSNRESQKKKRKVTSRGNKQSKNTGNKNTVNSLAVEKQAQLELKKIEKRRKSIVLLASLVAVASLGYFAVYYFFSLRTSMDYEELSALKGSQALITENTEKNNFSLHKSAIKLPDILSEYETLYQKNKKLIGWLKIDDTNIDYPVMQTDDNVYYLDHNFNQEYDKNGSIFLDCNCSVYPRSTNMIVYGHHMKSGNMFGNLQKYAKESYYKKHSWITFDTIYEKAQYEVMYVFRSQVFNDDEVIFKYYQFIEANSETEFNSYMEEMSKLSLYDTGVTAQYGDSLLTLSTCDSSQTDGRFVVVAKRVS